MSFLFLLLLCVTVAAEEEKDYVYERNSSFSSDRRFTANPLVDLRDLFYYKAAWTHEPTGLFDSVPAVYSQFLNSLDKDLLAQVMKVISEKTTNADKRAEARVVLIRYAYCYQKLEVYRNCPRPCNIQPCARYNLTNQVCRDRPFADRRVSSKIMASFPQLAPIFRFKAECTCPVGHRWVEDEETGVGNCDLDLRKCSDQSICSVHGACYPFDNEDGYLCKCFGGFRGLQCDELDDPCARKEEIQCGHFPCKRNPSNIYHGYQCQCGIHHMPRSEFDPVCVDRDECLQSPCKNNGTCSNTDGGYTCTCAPGFTGQDCYIDVSLAIELRYWNDWTTWSYCSRTCKSENEPGLQRRNRSCPVVDTCGDDSAIQIRDCIGMVLPECGDHHHNNLELSNIPFLMYSRNKTKKRPTKPAGVIFTNFGKNAALSLKHLHTNKFIIGKITTAKSDANSHSSTSIALLTLILQLQLLSNQ